MENRRELGMDELEQVTGGVVRTVDTGIKDLNAAIRQGAGTGYHQFASLVNGTKVNTVTDELVYDPVSQRNFVKITFTDKNGKQQTGWIAASIIGLPR